MLSFWNFEFWFLLGINDHFSKKRRHARHLPPFTLGFNTFILFSSIHSYCFLFFCFLILLSNNKNLKKTLINACKFNVYLFWENSGDFNPIQDGGCILCTPYRFFPCCAKTISNRLMKLFDF